MAKILFENCTLLDTRAGEARPGHAVLVNGDRIAELSDRPIGVSADVRIDVGGRVLMPGLIDAHVHAIITTMDLEAWQRKPITLVAHETARVLEGMLRRGFTTIRDAAGVDWGLAEAVRRGLIQGPRIFFSGRALSQTGGHGDFRPRLDAPLSAADIHSTQFAHVADGVDAVRKAAREELRRGANQLKLMASGGVASPTDPVWNVQYSAEEMRAAVEEAAGWRTYAVAHAYSPEAISRAVRAGVRTIEHGNLIDKPTARLMAENGAFLVPTLVTYYAMDELGRKLKLPAVSQQKVKDVIDAGLQSLEIARGAGVKMGWGTDLLGEAHDQQSREFSLRAQVLPAAEILRSATVINAEILQREGELGTVEPGAMADLLVVNGNPLDDIAVLAEPEKNFDVILKGGEFVVNRFG